MPRYTHDADTSFMHEVTHYLHFAPGWQRMTPEGPRGKDRTLQRQPTGAPVQPALPNASDAALWLACGVTCHAAAGLRSECKQLEHRPSLRKPPSCTWQRQSATSEGFAKLLCKSSARLLSNLGSDGLACDLMMLACSSYLRADQATKRPVRGQDGALRTLRRGATVSGTKGRPHRHRQRLPVALHRQHAPRAAPPRCRQRSLQCYDNVGQQLSLRQHVAQTPRICLQLKLQCGMVKKELKGSGKTSIAWADRNRNTRKRCPYRGVGDSVERCAHEAQRHGERRRCGALRRQGAGVRPICADALCAERPHILLRSPTGHHLWRLAACWVRWFMKAIVRI